MKETLLLLTLCAGLGCGSAAYAQDVRTRAGDNAGTQQPTQRTFSGRIVDEAGNPVVGATVRLIDRATGAVLNGGYTDAQGRYTVSTNSAATNLVVTASYVGLAELTVPAEANSSLTMKASDTQLAEVVVQGYGAAQQRREISSASSTVSGAEIQNLPLVSVDNALQGRIAGVQIQQGSGKLGQGVMIRVRGSKSISAGNQPLVVIDGVISNTDDIDNNFAGEPNNPLVDFNFNDVESITVLKDAAAAAIYGSRASNGVILITTKRGSAGRTRVNLNFYTGWLNETGRREYLNGPQYVELLNEAARNSGRSNFFNPTTGQWLRTGGNATRLPNFTPGANTDWQDEIFRTGTVQNYEASVAGGNEKTQFYFSFNYNTTDNFIIQNELDRGGLRLNLDHRISDFVRVGTSTNLIRTNNKRIVDDNAFSTFGQAVALAPIYPAFDPANPRRAFQGNPNPNGFGLGRGIAYYNPLEEVNSDLNELRNRIVTSNYIEVSFLKDFKFRTTWNLDYIALDQNSFQSSFTQAGTPNSSTEPGGTATNQTTFVTNWSTDNVLNYNKVFGDHRIDAFLGYTYQQVITNTSFVTGRDFPRGEEGLRRLNAAARITAGSSSESAYRFDGLFARGSYVWKDRLLLSASIRRDGSSKFGQNNRYGWFPAASLGYILTEGDLLGGAEWLSMLKPRLSYGITGNAAGIGDFAARQLLGNAFYRTEPGYSVGTTLADPNLKWETTATTNFGLDYGLFNDRITGTVDYYISNTSDLLLTQLVPRASGFVNVLTNVGELENRGLELSITAKIFDNPEGFNWSVTANYTKQDNEVTSLPEGSTITAGRGAFNRIVLGQPVAVFFGPEFAGVDPDNGDELWYRQDRTRTNDPNEAGNFVLGRNQPTDLAGLTSNFSWKGLELSVTFQGVWGNEIYNAAGVFMEDAFGFYDNQTARALSRWTPTNTNTNFPRLEFLRGTIASSRFIEDGSYIRLKTARLAYNFPREWLQSIKINSLQVYVTGSNLLTWTDYTGGDPEVSTLALSTIGQGQDFYTLPQARTFTVGFNLGF